MALLQEWPYCVIPWSFQPNAMTLVGVMVSTSKGEHETRLGLYAASPDYSSSLQCRDFLSWKWRHFI